jgi:hypothetical protein
MNNEFINARDQLFLEQVKEYFLSQSINGSVLQAGTEIPHNIYLGQLPDYGTVNVMYIPLQEDHFDDIRLLQFYAPVISEADPSKRSDLLVLLNEANFTCPLGSFSINDKNEIGFKYVFPVNRFEIMEEQPFLEIFNVYLDCLTSVRDAIMNLNGGNISVKEAIAKLGNN